jgi:hypothetical protein
MKSSKSRFIFSFDEYLYDNLRKDDFFNEHLDAFCRQNARLICDVFPQAKELVVEEFQVRLLGGDIIDNDCWVDNLSTLVMRFYADELEESYRDNMEMVLSQD